MLSPSPESEIMFKVIVKKREKRIGEVRMEE
jgi:hypothetical protein